MIWQYCSKFQVEDASKLNQSIKRPLYWVTYTHCCSIFCCVSTYVWTNFNPFITRGCIFSKLFDIDFLRTVLWSGVNFSNQNLIISVGKTQMHISLEHARNSPPLNGMESFHFYIGMEWPQSIPAYRNKSKDLDRSTKIQIQYIFILSPAVIR